MRKKTDVIAILAVAVLLCAGVGVGSAQESSPNSGGPEALVESEGVQTDGEAEFDYGTSSQVARSFVAHAFNPVDSGVTYGFSLSGNTLGVYRNNATGSVWLEAPVDSLPNGASIQAAEFRICDTSATKAFSSFLTINDKTGSGNVTQPQLVTTTAAETPGCINRTFTLATPIVVDNTNKAYSLEVNMGTGAGDNTIILSHARLFYVLQVSPAPATATFGTDVPTSHPFFQFVEALAAAGVTSGCAAGSYCPDQPVTRGQMAVFLSKALGLHFH